MKNREKEIKQLRQEKNMINGYKKLERNKRKKSC